MKEFKKVLFPENLSQCSSCGFTAPESEFEKGHSKWCKRSYYLLMFLIPFSVVYAVVGTIIVKVITHQ